MCQRLRAVKAFYDPINELVMIETTRGFRWGIPKARIPAITKASAEELVQLTLSPSGDGEGAAPQRTKVRIQNGRERRIREEFERPECLARWRLQRRPPRQ
jgi:hypothetical protein